MVTEGEMENVPQTVGLTEYVLETVPLRHWVTVLVIEGHPLGDMDPVLDTVRVTDWVEHIEGVDVIELLRHCVIVPVPL